MQKITLIKKFSLYCLVAIVIFAATFGWVITSFLEQNMLTRAKEITAHFVSEQVKRNFLPEEVMTPKTGDDYEVFSEKVNLLTFNPNIERVKIWNGNKVVVWSDDRRLVGQRFTDNEELNEALAGTIASEISALKKSEQKFEQEFKKLLELYVPIRFAGHGEIAAVFEIYQNLDPLYEDISRQRKIIWAITVCGFGFLYIVLFGIVWKASRLIDVQTKEIIQASERYRTLVQSAYDGIVSVNYDGKIVLFNRAAERIFGCAAEKIIGHDFTTLVAGSYRDKFKNMKDCFTGTAELDIAGKTSEIEGLRSSGQTFPMEISCSVSVTTATPVATLILRDISERRAMQNQLIKAERVASVSLVAGSIGHELNNSVSALMGYSELLAIKPEDSGLVKKSAEVFNVHSQRLKVHAGNLLSLSKPPKPEIKPVMLNEFIEKVTEALFMSGVLKAYTIVRDYDENIPQVMGDEMLLEQVIRNLEINAAHAMGGDGILTLGTRLSGDGSHVELSVADTGHGIPEDNREQIFLPFYTTKEEGKGTGLGMYIVKRIVEQHKGHIKLESKEGAGTKITIGLPAA